MAGSTVSRTAHFALHRTALDARVGVGREAIQTAESPAHAPEAQCAAPPTARPLFAVNEPWLGALIPKRWAKRAVTRNAIKRQIYTVSLTYEAQLPAAAHVVRLRAAFDRARFISATSPALKAAVRAELQQLFGAVSHAGGVAGSARPTGVATVAT